MNIIIRKTMNIVTLIGCKQKIIKYKILKPRSQKYMWREELPEPNWKTRKAKLLIHHLSLFEYFIFSLDTFLELAK